LRQAVLVESKQDCCCVYDRPSLKKTRPSVLCTHAMDWMPVVSQSKSLVQALAGDVEGAWCTQVAFTRSCPLVSQCRSLGELYMGHLDDARQTQFESCMVLNRIVNSIPVVGHIKGLVHYLCDDADGGDRAVRSATRTVGVVGIASGGMLLLGPAGGIVGGTCGGVFMDMLITSESMIKGKPEPYGYIAVVQKISFYPGCKKSGPAFELCAVAAFDALAGFGTASDLTGSSNNAPPVTTHHAVANPGVVSSAAGVTTGISHSSAIANIITEVSALYSVSDSEEDTHESTTPRGLLQRVGRSICLALRVVRAMSAHRALHGGSDDTSVQLFIKQHAKSVSEQQLLNDDVIDIVVAAKSQGTCRSTPANGKVSPSG